MCVYRPVKGITLSGCCLLHKLRYVENYRQIPEFVVDYIIRYPLFYSFEWPWGSKIALSFFEFLVEFRRTKYHLVFWLVIIDSTQTINDSVLKCRWPAMNQLSNTGSLISRSKTQNLFR